MVFGVWGMINPPEQPVIKTPDATIGILFNKFTGERSFAAFAVDADGHWGLTGRRHSAAAARAEALARCGDPKRPGLTASFQAALGIYEVRKTEPLKEAVFFALADDGAWAVQTDADGAFLPQWAVLNR